MSKPDQRTADTLKKQGWVGGRVEQWLPKRVEVGAAVYFELKIRRDFLGCVDSMWYRGLETLAVQATTGSNAAARMHKALMESPALLDYLVLGSNRRFQVWGWRQLKGGRRWSAKVVELVRTELGVSVVDCPDQPRPSASVSEEESSEPAEESA